MLNQKLLKIKLNFIENTINTSNEVLEILIKDESLHENKRLELMETAASYNRIIQSSVIGLKFEHCDNDNIRKLIENIPPLSVGRVSSVVFDYDIFYDTDELNALLQEDYIHSCKHANITLLDNIKIIKETL